MIGAITAWSGSIASIPVGWALCDGGNGTPDLRDRFVIGVGSSHALNSTGGAATVALSTANLPSHSHAGSGTTNSAGATTHSVLTAFFGNSAFNPYTGAGNTNLNQNTTITLSSSGGHTHSLSGTIGNTGSGQPHNNLPPYYALAFIMAVQ